MKIVKIAKDAILIDQKKNFSIYKDIMKLTGQLNVLEVRAEEEKSMRMNNMTQFKNK